MTEETKEKLRQINKGKKLSEEAKQKIGLRSKGNQNMLGKHHSEETKQRMSEARKGRTFSEETRKKLSEALMGNRNGVRSKQKDILPELIFN
jgi:hypothetical protein